MDKFPRTLCWSRPVHFLTNYWESSSYHPENIKRFNPNSISFKSNITNYRRYISATKKTDFFVELENICPQLIHIPFKSRICFLPYLDTAPTHMGKWPPTRFESNLKNDPNVVMHCPNPKAYFPRSFPLTAVLHSYKHKLNYQALTAHLSSFFVNDIHTSFYLVLKWYSNFVVDRPGEYPLVRVKFKFCSVLSLFYYHNKLGLSINYFSV